MAEDIRPDPDPTRLGTAQLIREIDTLRREMDAQKLLFFELRKADKDAIATALAALDKRGKGISEVIGWVMGVIGLGIALAAVFFHHG